VSGVRAAARRLIPAALLNWYRHRRTELEETRNAARSHGEVFDDIYRNYRWGGRGRAAFFSGHGSNDEAADPYVRCVRDFIGAHGIDSVCDLGCGDFRVGAEIASAVGRYIGIDVVPGLVDWLNANHAQPGKVMFRCADMAADPLPAANLYLIRQVLQHLSNDAIARVVANLPPAGWLIVTEHQPDDARLISPNRDKRSGSTIRLQKGSGVYLERPPFSLRGFDGMILEVVGENHAGKPEGFIRSFLFRLGGPDGF